MDLIGPWIVQVRGRPYEFDALTCIGTVTNLVELIRVDDKTSDTSQGDMHNVGYHVIRGHNNVYMILEENLLEKSFKLSYKTVVLRMYAQVQRIHRLMLYVKGCTKQLATS